MFMYLRLRPSQGFWGTGEQGHLFWGTGEQGHLFQGEQGNKGPILRGTGEQRQYWGTGNIENQIFDIWGTGEQANLFQGNKGTGTPLGGPQGSSENQQVMPVRHNKTFPS